MEVVGLNCQFLLRIGGNGNPVWYACLENSMGRGACQTIVHGVAKSRTRLNDYHSLTFA